VVGSSSVEVGSSTATSACSTKGSRIGNVLLSSLMVSTSVGIISTAASTSSSIISLSVVVAYSVVVSPSRQVCFRGSTAFS
jgi:hypothetical protein